MMRLMALPLVAIIAALPLTVLPSPYLGWIAVPAFLLASAGAITLFPPLTTAGAGIALIEYSVALTVAASVPDVVAATVFGLAIVLLLALVHFAYRTQGAAVSSTVIRSQVREWLTITAIAILAVFVLAITASALRLALPATAIPLVVGAALGGLVTVAAVVALLTIDGD
jgi:hypothetical protein